MKVLFFGSTSEITKCHNADIHIVTIRIKELRELLNEKWPELKNVTYVLAINKTIVKDDNFLLNNDAEAALLPPFSGG